MERIYGRVQGWPRHAALAATLLVASACGGGAGASPSASVQLTASPMAPATLAPTASPTLAPTASPTSAIVGDWIRTISCQQELAAFVKAGLTDQVQQWVVANLVPEGAAAPSGHECENASPPAKHSHFFTADGRFGSRDENGQQVDDGDYVLVDSNTLSFPSHANDFSYTGDILVDFTISGDTLTFVVKIPSKCEADCRVAYGWALSAFYGPQSFQRTSG